MRYPFPSAQPEQLWEDFTMSAYRKYVRFSVRSDVANSLA